MAFCSGRNERITGPDILPMSRKKKTVCASTVQLRNSSSATVNMRRPNLGFQIDPVGPIGCAPGGHSNQKPRADRNRYRLHCQLAAIYMDNSVLTHSELDINLWCQSWWPPTIKHESRTNSTRNQPTRFERRVLSGIDYTVCTHNKTDLEAWREFKHRRM